MRNASASIAHMRNIWIRASVARSEQFPVKKVIGFDRPTLDAIDAYRRAQTPIPNASEAIREILSAWLREHGYLG